MKNTIGKFNYLKFIKELDKERVKKLLVNFKSSKEESDERREANEYIETIISVANHYHFNVCYDPEDYFSAGTLLMEIDGKVYCLDIAHGLGTLYTCSVVEDLNGCPVITFEDFFNGDIPDNSIKLRSDNLDKMLKAVFDAGYTRAEVLKALNI